MINKRLIKKAFNYWQNKAPAHPLTCGNSCGNLKLRKVNNEGNLELYCPECNYTQIYKPDLLVQYYKDMCKSRKLKIKPFFRWFDLWIGVYIDTDNEAIYIIPIPMFGIKIYWKYKSILDEIRK